MMKYLRAFFIIMALVLRLRTAAAAPLSVAPWGFIIDLPEEYALTGGDMKSTFSFSSESGAVLDLKVYEGGAYSSVESLTSAVQKQIKNKGTVELFEYRKKKAAFIKLAIASGSGDLGGYGLCVELDRRNNAAVFLVALAYSAGGGMDDVHRSCLDSIAPNRAAFYSPGALSEYMFPRAERKPYTLAGNAGTALFFERDAEAAQAVVDREYRVLRRYTRSPRWKEAWRRFYRIVYRDSFERLQNAAFEIERRWNVPDEGARTFAEKTLKWTQGFVYERDPDGSDFVNLVSAAVEGRGDCDSRVLLWAIVLEQADIPAGIMVSREYSHAMGLADVDGAGARFQTDGVPYLVAETTASVSIGMIGQSVSDPAKWIPFFF
jgi:hypothetical protein